MFQHGTVEQRLHKKLQICSLVISAIANLLQFLTILTATEYISVKQNIIPFKNDYSTKN